MSREQAPASQRREEREEAKRRKAFLPKFVLKPGAISSSGGWIDYEIHLKNCGATARGVAVSVDAGAQALFVVVFKSGAMHTFHRKYAKPPARGIRMAIRFTDAEGVQGVVYFLGDTRAGGLHFEERDASDFAA